MVGGWRGSRDRVRLHLAVAGFGFAGVSGRLIGFGPVAIAAAARYTDRPDRSDTR